MKETRDIRVLFEYFVQNYWLMIFIYLFVLIQRYLNWINFDKMGRSTSIKSFKYIRVTKSISINFIMILYILYLEIFKFKQLFLLKRERSFQKETFSECNWRCTNNIKKIEPERSMKKKRRRKIETRNRGYIAWM